MQTKSDYINVNPMAENVDVEFPAFKIYFKVTRQNINLNLELSLAQLSLRLSHGKIMFKYLLGMKLRSFPRLQCEYLVLQNIWLANVGLVTSSQGQRASQVWWTLSAFGKMILAYFFTTVGIKFPRPSLV